MANWQQGLQGGMQGAAGGAAMGPEGAAIMGGVGLLSGFLGGGPKLPAELKRLYRFQHGQADAMRRFAQSVPLSDPQEMAALASQRGLLGEQQRNDTANLTNQYNSFAQGTNGLGDFLQNNANQQQGQQSALYGSAMQGALQRRFEAVGQAANIAQGAVGAASQYQQQPSMAAGFGDLARLIAYNQTMKANQPKNPPAGGAQDNTPGGVGWGAGHPPVTDPSTGPAAETSGSMGWGAGHPPVNGYGPLGAGQPDYTSFNSMFPGGGQNALMATAPADLLLRATGRR